jgi:hypothetical protein
MIDGLSREKAELLLRVENSLIYLKMKSSYFPDWDRREEDRLERIRREIASESRSRS